MLQNLPLVAFRQWFEPARLALSSWQLNVHNRVTCLVAIQCMLPISYFEIAGGGSYTLDTNLAALSSAASNASGVATTAFQLANQVATRCITAGQIGLTTTTGWSFSNSGGAYGDDYLQRARKPTIFHSRDFPRKRMRTAGCLSIQVVSLDFNSLMRA